MTQNEALDHLAGLLADQLYNATRSEIELITGGSAEELAQLVEALREAGFCVTSKRVENIMQQGLVL